jgi:hypothetical protein
MTIYESEMQSVTVVGCQIRGVFVRRPQFFDEMKIVVVRLSFINVQIHAVEIKQTMGQFVTSQHLDIYTIVLLYLERLITRRMN